MDNIADLIEERLNEMPPEITRAIQSVPWIKKAEAIAQSHRLDEEKTESLLTETALVVLGIESPENYPENLASQVALDNETVIAIAKEVELEIMNPIFEMIENNPNQENITPSKPQMDSNLPMIEEGEVAHDVPHVESLQPTTSIPLQDLKPDKSETNPAPKYTYQGGQDPYREPLA